jgi:hypothetical protein
MTFALCPDDGLPRLWRFVDDDTMTTAKLVALLDAKQNLLIINRPLFDQLGEMDRHQVLRTHSRCTYAG